MPLKDSTDVEAKDDNPFALVQESLRPIAKEAHRHSMIIKPSAGFGLKRSSTLRKEDEVRSLRSARVSKQASEAPGNPYLIAEAI